MTYTMLREVVIQIKESCFPVCSHSLSECSRTFMLVLTHMEIVLNSVNLVHSLTSLARVLDDLMA